MGTQAYWLRDSYVAIARAIEPIISAQGEGERWIALHPVRRERDESLGALLRLVEPGVMRVILDMT